MFHGKPKCLRSKCMTEVEQVGVFVSAGASAEGDLLFLKNRGQLELYMPLCGWVWVVLVCSGTSCVWVDNGVWNSSEPLNSSSDERWPPPTPTHTHEPLTPTSTKYKLFYPYPNWILILILTLNYMLNHKVCSDLWNVLTNADCPHNNSIKIPPKVASLYWEPTHTRSLSLFQKFRTKK